MQKESAQKKTKEKIEEKKDLTGQRKMNMKEIKPKKIELTKNQKKILENIKVKIDYLSDGEEMIITPKELEELGLEGKRLLEKFLENNMEQYYYGYMKQAYINGEKIDLEKTYLYIYKKRKGNKTERFQKA